ASELAVVTDELRCLVLVGSKGDRDVVPLDDRSEGSLPRRVGTPRAGRHDGMDVLLEREAADGELEACGLVDCQVTDLPPDAVQKHDERHNDTRTSDQAPLTLHRLGHRSTTKARETAAQRARGTHTTTAHERDRPATTLVANPKQSAMAGIAGSRNSALTVSPSAAGYLHA